MNNFLYRLIERDKNTNTVKDCYWSSYNAHPNAKISEIMHSIIFDEGKVIVWPCKNITQEEMDKLWEKGQRAFVLDFSYKEVIMYDIKFMSDKEWRDFIAKEDAKKNKKIIQILDIFETCDFETDSSISYATNQLKRILNENT